MLSFPASPTTGQQYTDTRGKVWEYDGVKWNIATTTGIKQFVGTKVSLATQVFLTATLTEISWDTEDIDTAGFFSSITPTDIVIPKTGYYRVHLAVYSGQEGNGTSYTVNLKRNATLLVDETMAAYQSGIYDLTLLLEAGDVITLSGAEENDIGRFIQGTYLEVQLIGYTFGGALIPGFEFSGVKAELLTNRSVSSTANLIEWSASEIAYNLNANAAGNVYWDVADPTRFTIATTGYYRLRAFFATGINGSSDSYTITVLKNGTELETITLGGNESAELDETYTLTTNDYLEIRYSNTENLGTIEAGQTFFELTRLGV
jgi:hypothetical protein